MPAEPQHVDTLISGVLLITLDPQRRIIKDGAIAIRGDRIVALGKREQIEPGLTARHRIDGRRFVATPGLVNAHVHITGEPLTRGYVPEALDFDENIFRWQVPLYQAHTPAEERLSAQLAALQMLRCGVTCFLEAGTIIDLDAVVDGLRESGIRGRVGQWVQDRAFDPADRQATLTDRAVRTLESELLRYPAAGNPLIAAWPNLIGHSTNTDECWRAAKALADAYGVGVTAHMSPAALDTEWFLANTGRRPVEHLDALGVLGDNLCLTHLVHIDAGELELLARSGSHVIHCPQAALQGAYGATAIGRFPEMAASGINLMLGTDGSVPDLMRSMFLAAGLFKDARRDPAIFPAHEALTMATRNGARGLLLEDQIGSLEVGKKADLVLHDLDRPEWRPLVNAVSQLVWSADGRGVHSVWVDGRRVVDNYRCTTLDEDALYAAAQAASSRITARTGLPERACWPSI